MWPWQKHRAETAQARNDRADAAARANAAEAQRKAAKRLAAQSHAVTTRLRLEKDRNGWTDLLLNSWGAR